MGDTLKGAFNVLKVGWIAPVLVGLAWGIVPGCGMSKKLNNSLPAEIQLQREQMTHQLSMQLDSTIERKFFEYNPDWIIPALFRPLDNSTPIQLNTFDGQTKDMMIIGIVEFHYRDSVISLKAFQEVSTFNPLARTQLLIPFKDETSGLVTYPGGRYLQISIPDQQRFTLDFNRCFFPYCAHSDRFICPIPPAENRVPFRVEAGEKNT